MVRDRAKTALETFFLERFRQVFGTEQVTGFVLEIEGDPAIAKRFSKEYPSCVVHALSDEREDLFYGGQAITDPRDLENQVSVLHGLMPQAALVQRKYDLVVSFGGLGRFACPDTFLKAIAGAASDNAKFFLLDFPLAEAETAQKMAKRWPDAAGVSPEIFAAGIQSAMVKDVFSRFPIFVDLSVEALDNGLICAHGRVSREQA